MSKISSNFSKIILMAIAPMALAFQAGWATLLFEFNNEIYFSKTNISSENLDRCNFEGTAPTSNWKASKEFTTYILQGEVIYIDKCTNLYGKFAANYGWVLDGKVIQYPLRWNADGTTKGFDFEVGYIMDVCERFKFIPQIGFQGTNLRTKIKNQRDAHNTPDCYADQSGNKSHSTLFNPYIGAEIDFTAKFCDCYDVQFSLSYDLGYVYGHGRDTTPYFFTTDDPDTSRYGSRIKYRDMISHDFELAAAYNVNKNWQVALEFDYNITYNTHDLHYRLERNDEIVETGQFTPSQYHVVNDYVNQNFGIIFNLIYNFSGEGGTYIR